MDLVGPDGHHDPRTTADSPEELDDDDREQPLGATTQTHVGPTRQSRPKPRGNTNPPERPADWSQPTVPARSAEEAEGVLAAR
ncbi:hypothetical protein GCM10009562_06540 [Nocardioides aquaticus]